MTTGISRDQAKEWWLRCVSCSEASATLINRDGGDEAPLIEQASHLFSGGFMHQGHACGHLWGAVLVAGMRASKTGKDEHAKSAAALHAANRLVKVFSEDGWALTCRENTGVELTDKVFQRFRVRLHRRTVYKVLKKGLPSLRSKDGAQSTAS